MKLNAGAPVPLGINFTFFVLYLAGLSAFGSFVNDMYQPSLPAMQRFFHTTVPTVQLGLTMGMVGLAVGQLILGPVSDKYGRKPVLMSTLALFCVAAAVSVFSPTIHFFLWCRLFQGLGASGAYFLARSIPADVFSGRTLARTMAIIGAINGFAPACAPVLGGIIADSFDWQGVFVTLIIIALVLLCLAPHFKETLTPDKRKQGSLLNSFADYKGLMHNGRFMTHVLLKGAALGILFAYISSAPFIMQTRFGFSQTAFGLIMGGNAIAVVGGSLVALRFKILKDAAWVGALGLLAAVALEAAALFLLGDFWSYELMLLPMLFSLGMIFTVSNTLAMNEGRANAGAASAILGIVGYVFGATVAPLVGLGNILHSTAITFIALTLITLYAALRTRRYAPDLNS